MPLNLSVSCHSIQGRKCLSGLCLLDFQGYEGYKSALCYASLGIVHLDPADFFLNLNWLELGAPFFWSWGVRGSSTQVGYNTYGPRSAWDELGFSGLWGGYQEEILSELFI